MTSFTEHVLGDRDRALHLEEGGGELVPWLLPRIVHRVGRDGREFLGLCRDHRWLSSPVSYPQDVPVCPQCESQQLAAKGQARFAAAVALGAL